MTKIIFFISSLFYIFVIIQSKCESYEAATICIEAVESCGTLCMRGNDENRRCKSLCLDNFARVMCTDYGCFNFTASNMGKKILLQFAIKKLNFRILNNKKIDYNEKITHCYIIFI